MTAFSFANQKHIRVAVAVVLAIFMAGILLQNATPVRGAEPVMSSADISIQGGRYGVINGDQIYTLRYDNSGWPIYNWLCAYDMGSDTAIDLNFGGWEGCGNYTDDFWFDDLVGVGSELFMVIDDISFSEDLGPGHHLVKFTGGNLWTTPILRTFTNPQQLEEADGSIFAFDGDWQTVRRLNTNGDLLATVSYTGAYNSVSASGDTFWISTDVGVHEYYQGSFVRTLNPHTGVSNPSYMDAVLSNGKIWISAFDQDYASDVGGSRLFGIDAVTGDVVHEFDDFGRDEGNGEYDWIGNLHAQGQMIYAYGDGFLLGVNGTTGELKSTLATSLTTIEDPILASGDHNRLMLYPVRPSEPTNAHFGAVFYSTLQFGNARFDAEGFIVNSETLFDGEAFAGTGATIDAWTWDFGDEQTASGEDVSHTYTEAGTFNVRLTVEMTDGSRAFAEQEIDIAPILPDTYEPLPPLPPLPAAPDINFNAEPIAGEAPLDVFFYSDTSAGGEPEIWAWDFGDGGTSALENPSHTYTTPGTYTVSLTVTNAAGSDTETKVDVIHAQSLPVAAFSATPLGGTTPLEVTFTNTSTNATSYSWDFGDGNTSTTASPVHTYIAAGTYSVSLTATNADGDDIETKTDYITVENGSPMPAVTGRIITQNSFNGTADTNAYPGTLTNGYMVNNAPTNNLRFTPRHLLTATPTAVTTLDVYYRATGAGSVRVCSMSYNLAPSSCAAWQPTGATLGSVQHITYNMSATDAWVWFEFLGPVTYDDLTIVDSNANIGTATASAVTAELSYYQAATNRTVWPFKSGPVTITTTFSEAPANTPAINIDQFGTTDVVGAAMTATGDPAVWTYDYSIMTQTGTTVSSTYRDGVIQATVDALDGNSVAVNPVTNGFFTNDTIAPVAPTYASGSMAALVNTATPLIKVSNSNVYNDVLRVYEDGTNLADTRCCGVQNGPTTSTGLSNTGFTVGPYADGTYSFTMQNTDVAGNVSPTSAVRTTTIDTTPPPVPSAPVLLNDSGVPDDNITNAVPMLFGGTAAPDTIVELYFSGTYLGQSTSDGSGNWTISVGSAWGGQLPFNARTRDAAGNLSAPSEYLYVTFYDVKPPVNLTLDPSSDSGVSGDFITNDNTPTLIASEDGIGEGLELYLDDVLVDSGTGTSLSTTLGPLADGEYTVEARTIDYVANIGTKSATLVIQTSAPADTIDAPQLDPTSDSGTLGDGLTNDNTPTVFGTAPLPLGSVLSNGLTPTPETIDFYSYWESGSPTALTDGDLDTYARLAYVQPQGVWYDLGAPVPVASVMVKIDNPSGTGAQTLMRIDARNSTGEAWTTIAEETVAVAGQRTIDIPEAQMGPWRYVRFVNTYAPGSTSSRNYMRWYETQITSAPAGSTVAIFDSGVELDTVLAVGGEYQLTLPQLNDGAHSLTARLADIAGNYGPDSPALALTIDATAPSSAATVSGAQSSLTFNVPYTANDQNGVAGVQLFYSANAEAALGDFIEFGSGFSSSPISFTAPAAGTYRFYTVATDTFGNIEAIPASADATIEVTLSGGNPPPDFGDMIADADGDTSWTIGASVINDPNAPSGDGQATRLMAPEGQQANAYSDIIAVEMGQTVTVTGSWRLSGHGTTVALCFDVGDCVDFVTLGDLNGATLYSIDWTEFTLTATVPDFSEWAYLYWTVGSDADIDELNWDFSTGENSTTRVEVETSTTVIAPALIDLGAGVPGDQPTANINVIVISNSATGYILAAAASDMTSAGSDVINNTALSARNTAGGSFANFTGDFASVQLAETSSRTDESGDTVNIDVRVLLPFRDGGLYTGTMTFTAAGH